MATVSNIKAALTFPADATCAFIKDGRTVGDAGIERIQDWFQAVYASELKDANGDPRAATANDFAAFLYRQIAGQVKTWERGQAEAAVAQPTELNAV